eukprot:6564636-Pyramimonas_sp.AAC.1
MRRLGWGRQQRWAPMHVWSAGTSWRTFSLSVASLHPRRWTGTGRSLVPRRKAMTDKALGANELRLRTAQ